MPLQTKTFESPTVNYYHLELILAENSVNVTDNTSSVAYKLVLHAGAANFYDYAVGHVITLAGKTVSAQYRPNAKQYSVEKYSSVVIASGTTNVVHNDDGTLNMPVAFSISIYKTDYTPGDISVSGVNMELTEIARASTIGATDSNIESVSSVIINKKSDAYTHSIQYVFGNISGYLQEDGSTSAQEKIFSLAVIAWKIPESFYAQIPDSPTGTCKLICTTYSGTTTIGEPTEADITITASPSLCAPSISGTVVDVNQDTVALTGDANVLVRFFSIARCIANASPKNSATVTQVSVNGEQANNNTIDFAHAETSIFRFEATDSRGYSSSYTAVKQIVPYIKLTNNATCARIDPTSGNAYLDFSGSYYDGGFGVQDNALTLKYKIDGGDEVTVSETPTIEGGKYHANIVISGLTYNSSHKVTAIASDKLNSVSADISVKKGTPVFEWGENDFKFYVKVFGTDISAESVETERVLAMNVSTEHASGGTADFDNAEFNKIALKGSNVASIIVESSHKYQNGVWDYNKYADGTCDMWVRQTVSVQTSSQMGSLYRSAVISMPDYPFNVTSAFPMVSFLIGSNNYSADPWNTAEGTETAPPEYYLVRHNNVSVNGTLVLYVHGRYKI